VPDLRPLLLRLAGQGRPRLTWYSGDERVELSGHVLGTWVTKTAHLLVDELDAAGRPLLVDLPVHWRAAVWSLAALRVGSPLVTDPASPTAAAATLDGVVVTDRPDRYGAAQDLVVVALPALARTAGPVPAGAIDAASVVLGFPDHPAPWPDPRPDDAALPDLDVRHGDLLAWAAGHVPVRSGARILLRAGTPADLVAATLAALAADASLVLGDAEWTGALVGDPERRARLVATERVDLDLLDPDHER
jgi:uncharacterized protein (TIGR03089 family)